MNDLRAGGCRRFKDFSASLQKKAEQPPQNTGLGLRSCDKPMTDERLAEIEVYLETHGWDSEDWQNMMPELLAEIRRLRRENHLLTLSRGDLSVVGQD